MCPSTSTWIDKLWNMHTVEYYTAVKMSGILRRAATDEF